MAAGEKPKITWEASFANTLEFGYPLDEAVAYSEPREGSEWAQAPSGEVDAWITGTDQLLAGTARWIPAATGTTPEGTPITGWDGAAGWDAFLIWMRAGNTARFFPDRDGAGFQPIVLVEPMRGAPEQERDGKRRVRLVLRSTDDTAFTGY